MLDPISKHISIAIAMFITFIFGKFKFKKVDLINLPYSQSKIIFLHPEFT